MFWVTLSETFEPVHRMKLHSLRLVESLLNKL